MPVTVKVNGVANSLVHKGSNTISIATIPDVCKTPTPGGPVPMPYPNVSQSATLSKGTTTVKADGGMMIAIKGSEFSMSNGDEPGTVGGVKSNTFIKESTWILYSFDVKIEGQGACRLSDKKLQNHENTADMMGVVVTPTPVSPPGDPQCDKLHAEIEEEIYVERPPTPHAGRPQGRQGMATRWKEFAENMGGHGKRPDGSLGKKAQGHLGEYRKQQGRLRKMIDKWDGNNCAEKTGKDLPHKARQYAGQEPELGPGKPTEPSTWSPAYFGDFG